MFTLLYIYGLSGLFTLYLLVLAIRAYRRRPRITKADILYQEWNATGYSGRDWLKIGWPRPEKGSCVRLIVTPQYLIVTSYFPFLLFSAFHDMEHVIPLQRLEPVRIGTGPRKAMILSYRDEKERSHKIFLFPQDRKGFLMAIAGCEDREKAAV